MRLERTALPTSWGRISPEYLNLTLPLVGPTGNLRAPTVRAQAVVFVEQR